LHPFFLFPVKKTYPGTEISKTVPENPAPFSQPWIFIAISKPESL